jgi:hypothetical protein
MARQQLRRAGMMSSSRGFHAMYMLCGFHRAPAAGLRRLGAWAWGVAGSQPVEGQMRVWGPFFLLSCFPWADLVYRTCSSFDRGRAVRCDAMRCDGGGPAACLG